MSNDTAAVLIFANSRQDGYRASEASQVLPDIARHAAEIVVHLAGIGCPQNQRPAQHAAPRRAFLRQAFQLGAELKSVIL